MCDLERVLQVLLGRIGSQNNVSNLNELFRNLFAERVGILSQEIFIIVKKHDHHSQSAFVKRLHARGLQDFLILFKEFE